MASIDDIIARLGGSEAAARLTGVGLEAIRKWRQARAVPSKHWQAVVAATGLTLADLSSETGPEEILAEDGAPAGATAVLVLADGGVFWGVGFGAFTSGRVGELCFNTGMTGYQETLTDPSYAGQLITFTFPHIGNVGTNTEDAEATNVAALGLIVKQDITDPSNWRSTATLDAWLKARGVPGLARVDTRALTLRIRRRAAHGGAVLPGRRQVRSAGAAGAGGVVARAGGHGPRQAGELHPKL